MPRQITEKQRLKLLAAAELVQGGDMAVLKKIIQFQEFLEDNEDKIKQMIVNLVKVQADSEFKDTKGGLVDELAKSLESLKGGFEKLGKGVSKDLSKEIRNIKIFAESLKVQIETVKSLIPELPPETDLSDIFTKFKELESKIPTIPEQLSVEDMRNGLEVLQKDERLDVSAIKGLEEEIKKYAPAGRGGGVRRVFQPYRDNFTSQTDGATKTFYLSREPLKIDTIMAWGTDFPIILDPDTDFTVNGKKFTLTDAVDAPTAGASFIVQFYA